MTKPPKNPIRRYILHAYRVGVLVFIVTMIHQQHRWYVAQQRGAMKQRVTVEQARAFYPEAHSLSNWVPTHGGQTVVDSDGDNLGYVVQTSPDADDVIGFSGPTNMMIALDKDDRVIGTAALRSADTHEHVADVLNDELFMTRLNGLTWSEAGKLPMADGVSGATLTSMAMADSIAIRLGGNKPSSRFPDEITVEEIKPFLPDVQSLEIAATNPNLLVVLDNKDATIGFAARTSPYADTMMGYQGPTDTLIVIDTEHVTLGFAIRHSYDNNVEPEEFVRYVREDDYFFNTFVGFRLKDIAQLDMVNDEINGVSGATKTSTNIAEAIIHTSGELLKVPEKHTPKARAFKLATRDIGTIIVVLCGVVIGLTHLRGRRRLRIAFQLLLIIYLGFINADMASQALLVGWSQNGIAWRGSPALVLLTVAALLAPVFTGRQVYCTHVCPHGALQDLLRRRIPYRVALRRRARRLLTFIPALLLLWVVIVAMLHLRYSLVNIEPFNAYVFRVAGWATITVAIVGLIASLFVPMAFCRYGCPTGAMLNFLRFSSGSDRFSMRDVFASVLALVSLGLYIWAS